MLQVSLITSIYITTCITVKCVSSEYNLKQYYPLDCIPVEERNSKSMVNGTILKKKNMNKNRTMQFSESNTTSLNLTKMFPHRSCSVDSEFRYTLFTVFYSIIFIVGLVANCYVLWVFARMHRIKRMSEIKIYMINLTVADLLFIMTLPQWIIYYNQNGDWTLHPFLCKLSGSLFFVNTYCSIAFLAVISFNRYWAVTKPLETAQSNPRRRGVVVSVVIWVIIGASASPYLFMDGLNKNNNKKRCFEWYGPQNTWVAITNLLIIACFFLVFIFILVSNLLIARTLLSQPVQQQGSIKGGIKQRALRMVFAVLGVFVVCFVPHHLISGPWTMAVLGLWRKEDCDLLQTLNDAHQVTLCLAGLNCILDPIIYCFTTTMFRRYLTERIQQIRSHFEK
ncbi:platelet-activating factor receptor-like isoform X2 [Polyodon spathula]|uniref:platelet-activating factor receptor-like isoform X2 n=1 Tax=Polyodon spathula TaxID=7913 RepID=UPI001B7E06B4|nr:platelet-activating factor receptor-like isoform X2 [Polyodon spathula]